MMRRPPQSSVGGALWILLDLEVAGSVYRYTTRPGGLVVPSGEGVDLVYSGGLDASVPARVADSTSTITVQVQPEGDQWARLAAMGVSYDRARAIVRTCYVSDSGGVEALPRCVVAMDGYLSSVSYGDAYTPLTGTIEVDDLGTGVAPSLDSVIGPSTFPGAYSDKCAGKTYPLVVGRPGQTGAGTSAATTPGYLVDYDENTPENSRIMIAGHAVHADSVTVEDDDGVSDSLTVLTDTDALGQTYSYVVAGTTLSADPDRTYSVAWDDGGGIIDPRDSTAYLSGAGSIIEYLLTTYAPGLRLDLSRQTSVRGELDRYRLDFAVTSSVDPVAFVRSTIASVIRVDEHRTSGGVSWLPRRLTATHADSMGHLDADPGGNFDLAPLITVESGNIANVIRLQYGLTGREKGQALTLIADRNNLSDSDSTITDPRKRGSYACRVSQDRYGRRVSAVSTSVIMDDDTAGLVLSDLVAARSWPRRMLSGTSYDMTAGRYEPGDVLTLTHSGLLLDDTLCILRSVQPMLDTVEMQLELADDPARDLRYAGVASFAPDPGPDPDPDPDPGPDYGDAVIQDWRPLDLLDAYGAGLINVQGGATVTSSAPGEYHFLNGQTTGNGYQNYSTLLFEAADVFDAPLKATDIVEVYVSIDADNTSGSGSRRIHAGLVYADPATYPTNARGYIGGAYIGGGGIGATELTHNSRASESSAPFPFSAGDGFLGRSMVLSDSAPISQALQHRPSQGLQYTRPEDGVAIPAAGGVTTPAIIVCISGANTGIDMEVTIRYRVLSGTVGA